MLCYLKQIPHWLRRFRRLPFPAPCPAREDSRPCARRRGRAIPT
ncbi:hypothetical protein DESPIG_02931 [Desulfovibrio piger ATCC 29098]|uniref:Uncharacterized protein n=1 Tax=Desulfovibrio piger ATCC 29098 TaxID=411464 RepID=B6WXV1_9BACT|nr:hypothetical protein DESPIG_02931 [Desulfovibrio piger ATCC 29098]